MVVQHAGSRYDPAGSSLYATDSGFHSPAEDFQPFHPDNGLVFGCRVIFSSLQRQAVIVYSVRLCSSTLPVF